MFLLKILIELQNSQHSKVLNKLTYNKIIHDRIFRPYNYLGKDNDIELVCAWNQLPNQELSLSYLKDVKSKHIEKSLVLNIHTSTHTKGP